MSIGRIEVTVRHSDGRLRDDVHVIFCGRSERTVIVLFLEYSRLGRGVQGYIRYSVGHSDKYTGYSSVQP